MILLVSACGSDGTVAGFDADPGPISVELVGALQPGTDPDTVPEVQRNFLELCVKGGEDSLPDLPTVQREGLLAVCGCTYDALVEASFEAAEGSTPDERASSAFAYFTGIEDDLRAEGTFADEVADLVRVCIRAEAGL